jgi:hypothetical protein
MKLHLSIPVACIMLTIVFSQKLLGQSLVTTDVPRTMSYQGQVMTSDNVAANGIHQITASLYSDHLGKNSIWHAEYSAEIVNGVFNILLGSGKSPLPDVPEMNRSLWVGIRVDGGEEMRPLTQLSAVPYAMNVPDKSITLAKLAPEVLFGSGYTPMPQSPTGFDELTTATNTTATMTVGSGSSLTISGTGTITANQFVGSGSTSNAVDLATAEVNGILPQANGGTGSSAGSWILGGNALSHSTGTDWLGSSSSSTGSKEVWIKTNSNTVMRYVPASGTGSTPNIIGGQQGNIINNTNIEGSVIAGGGMSGDNNYIAGNFAFVGSGFGNTIGTSADNSAIAGGKHNLILSKFGFVGGGYYNQIECSPANDGSGSEYNTIGGGRKNLAGDNVYGDSCVFVGGGDSNWAREEFSAIVGGRDNITESASTFIGGGEHNRISHEAIFPAGLSSIVGGDSNSISSNLAFIGGGKQNKIHENSDTSVIGGGFVNEIFSVLSTIGGGDSNVVYTHSRESTIGGGSWNVIDHNIQSVISGGQYNWIFDNSLPSKLNSIGGGFQNRIWGSTFSTISGGNLSKVDDGSNFCTIGGGGINYIGTGFVGGTPNPIEYATIPGGNQLIAQSYGQTVVGVFNIPKGNNAATDFNTQPIPVASGGDNPLFIVGNGNAASRSNAFEVSNDGHSIVFDVNNTGGATPNGGAPAVPNRTALYGGTYTDNIIYAWGYIIPNPTNPPYMVTVNSDFGVATVQRVIPGKYLITLNTSVPLKSASIVATIVDTVSNFLPMDSPESEDKYCWVITTSALDPGTQSFVITTKVLPVCQPQDHPFMFHVTGR